MKNVHCWMKMVGKTLLRISQLVQFSLHSSTVWLLDISMQRLTYGVLMIPLFPSVCVQIVHGFCCFEGYIAVVQVCSLQIGQIRLFPLSDKSWFLDISMWAPQCGTWFLIMDVWWYRSRPTQCFQGYVVYSFCVVLNTKCHSFACFEGWNIV